MRSTRRRRPGLWLLSGLGLVAFFLLLGAGSANAETDSDSAAADQPGLVATVGEVGAALVSEQVAPVTDAVREGVVQPVVEPVTEPVVEPVRDAVRPVVKPVRDVVEPVVKPVRDVVEPVVKPVREQLLEPVTQPVREAVRPITEPVRDAVEPVTAPVRDEVDEQVDEEVAEVAPAVVDDTPEQAPEVLATESSSGAGKDAEDADDADDADNAMARPAPNQVASTTVVAADSVDPATTADDAGDRSVPGTDDEPAHPIPAGPQSDTVAVLTTSTSSHSGGHGDNPVGAAAGVLPDSRTDWHHATWSVRVVPRDHALPRSATYRPGFSPD